MDKEALLEGRLISFFRQMDVVRKHQILKAMEALALQFPAPVESPRLTLVSAPGAGTYVGKGLQDSHRRAPTLLLACSVKA